MTLNSKSLPRSEPARNRVKLAAANADCVVAAIGRRSWGARYETVTKRVGDLLVLIDELHSIGHSPGRQIACSELGDLIASFAIDYLKQVPLDQLTEES